MRPSTFFVPLAIAACLLLAMLAATGISLPGKWTGITALREDRAEAEQQAITIINQPVASLPRTGEAGEVSPGWFHPGALTPDFSTVDIRTTQEFPYDRYTYVTSDVSPQVMYDTRQVEFNAMTKIFYQDRSVPKKRLTEAEMERVNQLYRVIGHDNDTLARRYAALGIVLAGSIAVLALLWLVLKR